MTEKEARQTNVNDLIKAYNQTRNQEDKLRKQIKKAIFELIPSALVVHVFNWGVQGGEKTTTISIKLMELTQDEIKIIQTICSLFTIQNVEGSTELTVELFMEV